MIENFRVKAKRMDNGEWIYGTGLTDFLNLFPDLKGHLWLWSNYGWIAIEPESICRYTGFKDHYKKKEIFENDKVRVFWNEYGSGIPEGFTGIVEMIDGGWWVYNEVEKMEFLLFQELASWEIINETK